MFLFSCLLFWSLVMVCVMLPLPSCCLCYWFLCSMCHVLIGCHIHCVMSPLVCSCHVFVISSHVLAFSSCCVLMLLPAVGESSLFMPSQVCLLSSLCQVKSSLSLFGCHHVNKLHLGSSLRSPSMDCSLQNTRPPPWTRQWISLDYAWGIVP